MVAKNPARKRADHLLQVSVMILRVTVRHLHRSLSALHAFWRPSLFRGLRQRRFRVELEGFEPSRGSL
jgi:hypothetical protein